MRHRVGLNYAAALARAEPGAVAGHPTGALSNGPDPFWPGGFPKAFLALAGKLPPRALQPLVASTSAQLSGWLDERRPPDGEQPGDHARRRASEQHPAASRRPRGHRPYNKRLGDVRHRRSAAGPRLDPGVLAPRPRPDQTPADGLRALGGLTSRGELVAAYAPDAGGRRHRPAGLVRRDGLLQTWRSSSRAPLTSGSSPTRQTSAGKPVSGLVRFGPARLIGLGEQGQPEGDNPFT